MKSTVGIFAVLCVVAVIAQATVNVITVPKQCSPEALETSSDPEMNRRLCQMFISYVSLPAAAGPVDQEQYYSPSLNSGKKRQNGNDDHVFLRFGRRR